MSGKTITRADLVEVLREEVDFSRKEYAALLESVLGEIANCLIEDAPVKISTFGSFIVRQKGERMGRNPNTGEPYPIRKVDDETCFVSFFQAHDNLPIRRPWCAEKLSVEMVAICRPEYGPELVVELWEEGAGFTLHLNIEAAYILDDAGRDALVPALSRYEKDEFLDQYYRYFRPLEHYTRRTA